MDILVRPCWSDRNGQPARSACALKGRSIETEHRVGSILLTYGLIFVVMALSLWAGAMFLQSYLYEAPQSEIYWRGPATALALTVFYLFWAFLDYRSPGSHNALFEFSTGTEEEFPQIWAVKKGKEILYEKHRTPAGKIEYVDPRTNKPFSRSDAEGIIEAIIVENKDKERFRFDADLTPDGKFKAQQGELAKYIEVDGRKRVMSEGTLGRLSERHWGLIFANLLLNLIHLVVWILAIWTLLRFTIGHAILISLVVWLVMTLVLPFAFRNVEVAARKAQAAKAQASFVNWSPECA